MPAILGGVVATLNGEEVNPSRDFEHRLLRTLGGTGLFSTIRSQIGSTGPESCVRFSMGIDEDLDSHQGKAILHGFLIGLTLYLLTPALPLQLDFESQMTLDAVRPDGDTRRVYIQCKGVAYYHLLANAVLAEMEVGAKVTTNNLNSLISQVVQDAEWFRQYGIGVMFLRTNHDVWVPRRYRVRHTIVRIADVIVSEEANGGEVFTGVDVYSLAAACHVTDAGDVMPESVEDIHAAFDGALGIVTTVARSGAEADMSTGDAYTPIGVAVAQDLPVDDNVAVYPVDTPGLNVAAGVGRVVVFKKSAQPEFNGEAVPSDVTRRAGIQSRLVGVDGELFDRFPHLPPPHCSSYHLGAAIHNRPGTARRRFLGVLDGSGATS